MVGVARGRFVCHHWWHGVARGRFVCHHLLITRRGYQKNENCMLNNVNLHMVGIGA